MNNENQIKKIAKRVSKIIGESGPWSEKQAAEMATKLGHPEVASMIWEGQEGDSLSDEESNLRIAEKIFSLEAAKRSLLKYHDGDTEQIDFRGSSWEYIQELIDEGDLELRSDFTELWFSFDGHEKSLAAKFDCEKRKWKRVEVAA